MTEIVGDANLDSVKALRDALRRIPNGVEAANLFNRLGLWTKEAHLHPSERQPFPARFSNLSADELSDLSARVIAEVGVIGELVGLLTGIESQLKIKMARARAGARVRARRALPVGSKAPPKAELDDLAEEDLAVMEVEEQTSLLLLLKAQASACKEANMLYKDGVSREITYRAAQLQSRVTY